MGKHTSSSPIIRKRLEEIFAIPGVKRTIHGITTGCSHSMKFGHMKFRSEQPGKLIYVGYHAAGIIKIIIVVDKNSNINEIKNKIAIGNP